MRPFPGYLWAAVGAVGATAVIQLSGVTVGGLVFAAAVAALGLFLGGRRGYR